MHTYRTKGRVLPMEAARAWYLMRLLMVTVTLSAMTALMFNIVLPQVSEEFRLSYAQASWLTSGYTIIYAFGTVIYGKLADRFSLRNLLTFGLLLFAAGSLLVWGCFPAHTGWRWRGGVCSRPERPAFPRWR